MFKTISAGLITTCVALSAAGEANAWSRYGTVSGPHGTAKVQAQGSCAGGSCTRAITRTGPYGETVSRSGSVACSGGYCTGSRTTTGPRGNTVNRSGSFHRY